LTASGSFVVGSLLREEGTLNNRAKDDDDDSIALLTLCDIRERVVLIHVRLAMSHVEVRCFRQRWCSTRIPTITSVIVFYFKSLPIVHIRMLNSLKIDS
jgi:hypothetical protein